MRRVLRRNRVANGAILGIVSTAILFQQITSAMCAICLLHQLGVPVGSCCQAKQTHTSISELPISLARRSCCDSGSSKPSAGRPLGCCSGSTEENSSGGRCSCIKDDVVRAVFSPSIALHASIDESFPFASIPMVDASPSMLVSSRTARNLDLPPPSCPRFVRFHRLLI